jgi:hypothetical protein
MTTRFAVPAVAVATLVLASACSSSRPGALAPEPAAQLAQVARAEQMAGTHIYEGRVYSMDTSRTSRTMRLVRSSSPKWPSMIPPIACRRPT